MTAAAAAADADVRDVVVVGAGGMGRAWMDVVRSRNDLRPAAVVDIDLSAAQAAAAERDWNVPVFDDVAAALQEVRADLLLNVTIPEAHRTVSEIAIRAGVPVLSEKPVTPTVADAMWLSALSVTRGVLLATSQSRRHSAGISVFRDALRDLGGAGQLQTQFFQNPRFGGFRDEMASPLLVDMAIHQFDQARYLLGSEPESVYCEEFSPAWSWYGGAAAAQAIFRFSGGARFGYAGSWCADGLTTSWNGDWRASAPGGSATWDGETAVRMQRGGGGVQELPVGAAREGLDAALTEFLAALEGGEEPSGEIRQNIRSLAMVEAAGESAATGATVELDSVFARAGVSALAEALAAGETEIADQLRAWAGGPPR
ncbi:Gfo/Idh/MocA family protein [Microbacterium sp. NPDC087591]|uniref:Gfo/Idh/MocA family protein n=1 Tax=Microbacterium sp. NPDC087591 TaxID=3364192 RepID=UPI00382AE783